MQRPVRVQRGLMQQQGCPARHHGQDTGGEEQLLIVVDPHHVDVDPDSDFLFDVDPDPTFHLDADLDPDPDPGFKKKGSDS